MGQAYLLSEFEAEVLGIPADGPVLVLLHDEAAGSAMDDFVEDLLGAPSATEILAGLREGTD